MGGLTTLARLDILERQNKSAKETSVEIWKFLDQNFQAKKDKDSGQDFVWVISNNEVLKNSFVMGGLLYVITEEFPTVKTNVLIPTQFIIREWVKSKTNSFFRKS